MIHRDYSIHTENEPIRIEIYPDRIEVSNPGGLYGRLSIDDLGKIKADVRKPRTKEVLAKEFGFDEKHPAYFINNYILPLIDEGKLKYTIPKKPKSKNQKIVLADN